MNFITTLWRSLFAPEPEAASTEAHEHCTDDEVRFIRKVVCPDCRGVSTFLRGPTGGLSINIACENCGAEFNVLGPMGADRISPRGKPNFVRLLSVYHITPTKERTP